MPHRGGRGPGQLHRRIISEIEKGKPRGKESVLHPSFMLVYLYSALILIGALLLWLPRSAASGRSSPFVDALFTATSAASATGLAVVDTASYWGTFGQQVIIGLIQIGGLASLIVCSILLLRIARRATGQERFLLRESMHISSAKGIIGLIVGITFYALMIEVAGGWLLYHHLSATQPRGVAIWWGIFHSVSAFNNAGFEIMGLAGYKTDSLVNLTLAVLAIIGGISFLVAIELARVRGFSRLSLDSKLVLTVTAWLLGLGTAAILWSEFNNAHTIGDLPFWQKLLSAFFHSANARTTGLSTLDLGQFAVPTLLVIIILMFIGGASGSTAGGIKVNTFGLLFAATRSAVLGKGDVELLGGPASAEQVNRAIAITFLSVGVITIMTFILATTEKFQLLKIVFEVVSAYTTTGYSTGITPQLSTTGKLVLVVGMFAGKVGPLTLAFALAHRQPMTRYTYTQEVINLG